MDKTLELPLLLLLLQVVVSQAQGPNLIQLRGSFSLQPHLAALSRRPSRLPQVRL